MAQQLKQQLIELLQTKGIPYFGVAPVTHWESKTWHQPTDLLTYAKTVVVLGCPIPRTSQIEHPFRNAYKGESLKSQLLNLGAYYAAITLEDHGFRTLIIPTSDFADSPEMLTKDPTYKELMHADLSLRYAGVKAGIGVIGKSGMLLHPKHGPFLGLSAVITDAPLPTDQSLTLDLCGDCTECISHCYTGALTPDGLYDPVRCNTDPKGKIALAGINHLVCPAACRKACPIGDKTIQSSIIPLNSSDPFIHTPYDTYHHVPPQKKPKSEL